MLHITTRPSYVRVRVNDIAYEAFIYDKPITSEFSQWMGKKALYTHSIEDLTFQTGSMETYNILKRYKTKTPYFFIDGTACLGKTTLLKKLEFAIPVLKGDYLENCRENPIWLSKSFNPMLSTLYDHFCWSRAKPLCLMDRTPVAAMLYDLIFKDSFELSFEDWVSETTPMLVSFTVLPQIYSNWHGLINIFNGNEDIMVERMKKRNNGIDSDFTSFSENPTAVLEKHRQYVMRQNFLFSKLKELLPNSRLVLCEEDMGKSRELQLRVLVEYVFIYYCLSERKDKVITLKL